MDSASRLTRKLCHRERIELTDKTMVRERASMLMSACLDIIKTREKSQTETYKKIFEEARAVLVRASSTDAILGSMLAFGAMLQNQQLVCPTT